MSCRWCERKDVYSHHADDCPIKDEKLNSWTAHKKVTERRKNYEAKRATFRQREKK